LRPEVWKEQKVSTTKKTLKEPSRSRVPEAGSSPADREFLLSIETLGGSRFHLAQIK
jgi:hypothetical protein